jgi:hypothetical protein
MATYFTTWDFNTPADFCSAKDMELSCASGEPVDYRWSSSNRSRMEVGSTLIMVRQGRPPRVGGLQVSMPERR